MRVGLDVAPLLQTRAGTARWVSGLRRGLEARADVERRAAHAGAGRGGWTAVARDVLWYPGAAPARRPRERARRRPPLHDLPRARRARACRRS